MGKVTEEETPGGQARLKKRPVGSSVAFSSIHDIIELR